MNRRTVLLFILLFAVTVFALTYSIPEMSVEDPEGLSEVSRFYCGGFVMTEYRSDSFAEINVALNGKVVYYSAHLADDLVLEENFLTADNIWEKKIVSYQEALLRAYVVATPGSGPKLTDIASCIDDVKTL